MAVVSVSLPDTLLQEADAFIQRRGYSGRSDVVRAALRDFLARERDAADGNARRTATLTLLYPDGYERKIGEIRHHFGDVVRSMMHGHAGDSCVELFLVEGPATRLREFADALRAAKETRLVRLVHTDDEPR